jgi:hypothetical protein
MAEENNEMRAGGSGLVQVKTAVGTLEAQERERNAHLAPKKFEKSTLAGYVLAVFNENKDHRMSSGVEEDLLDNLRRRVGEYSPTKLGEIKRQNGSAIFAEITGVKCRNAESWLSDVFSPDDEKSWSLNATPVPEIPAEAEAQVAQVAQAFAVQEASKAMQSGQQVSQQQVQQIQAESQKLLARVLKEKLQAETDKRVRNMERKMYDQLLEGEWDKVLDSFLFDLTTFPAAIMKGPIVRMRKTRKWEISEDGTSELVIGREPRPVFERVSPFDFFPSPLAKDGTGPGAMVERLWLTRSALEDMKEFPGYSKTTIERLLKDAATLGTELIMDSVETERRDLERRGEDMDASSNRDSVQGLEFHGNVPGSLLIEHGIKEDNNGKSIRLGKEYSAEVILVANEVIYVSLNPDKLDRHPYSSTSWSKMAGAFWGEGVPQLLKPVQDVCNASLRALVNNMGFASGPQCSVTDIDRIPLNEELSDIYPFKVWQWTNERNMTADPIKFFMIPSNANELYSVYENFKKQADDDSGIPAYSYGNERTAGAGRTASGLSMLMTGASRGIKKVIRNVHRDVIRQSLERLYDWNMQFDDDPSIKGDADIVAVGAVAVLTREQASSRRLELLNMASNPTDMQLFGLKNRANLWRQTLDTLEFDGSSMLLTDEEIEELEKTNQDQAQQVAQAQSEAAQAEAEETKADIEVKLGELKVKQQKADQDYEIELAKLEQAEAEADSAEIQAVADREIAAKDKKDSAKKEKKK